MKYQCSTLSSLLIAATLLPACGASEHTSSPTSSLVGVVAPASAAATDPNAGIVSDAHLDVQSPNLTLAASGSGCGATEAVALPYVLIATDANNRDMSTATVWTAYSYDPCLFEATHGAFTVPDGGTKVEVHITVSQGDGAPWVFPGTYALGTAASKDGRVYVADAKACSAPAGAVQSGQVDLTGESMGGSGKEFSNGVGNANLLVDSGAKITGAFQAGHCINTALPQTAASNVCIDTAHFGGVITHTW